MTLEVLENLISKVFLFKVASTGRVIEGISDWIFARLLSNSIAFNEVFIIAFSGMHTSAQIRKSIETSIDESEPVFS